MVTEPEFSFLTTAYRTEQYLPQTIDSVLEQTFGSWEMIVVDNGYSDELAEIVESYASRDHRIHLVRQENRGYRGGVMAAAAAARGRFLCVLDSDDHLMPTFCERIANFVRSNPNVDAVGIDAHRFCEPDGWNLPIAYMRSIGVNTTADSSRPLTLAEVIGGCVPYYTAAIRRAAWDTVGGYEPGIEDVDESVIIWCRLAQEFDVRLLSDRLARYRLRPDSLSRDSQDVERFEHRLVRSFIEGARVSAEPEDYLTLARTLRGIRYHQAIRRARDAIRAGETTMAQAAARSAFGERRTLRSGMILAALFLAPGIVRRFQPVKQKAMARAERVIGQLRLS